LAENEMREALLELDSLWAELFSAGQARVIQPPIDCLDIGTGGLTAQMVAEIGIIAGKSRNRHDRTDRPHKRWWDCSPCVPWE
jgi:hypothetical protein